MMPSPQRAGAQVLKHASVSSALPSSQISLLDDPVAALQDAAIAAVGGVIVPVVTPFADTPSPQQRLGRCSTLVVVVEVPVAGPKCTCRLRQVGADDPIAAASRLALVAGVVIGSFPSSTRRQVIVFESARTMPSPRAT